MASEPKKRDDYEWMTRLLREHRAGQITEPPASLPPLPEDATDSMRRVADLYAVVLALHRREDMPGDGALFCCKWVGEQIGRSGMCVSTALRGLAAAGVMHRSGTMRLKSGRLGTLWAPGRRLPLSPRPIQVPAERVGPPVEPAPPVLHDGLVGGAEQAGGDSGVPAAPDSASAIGGGGRHAQTVHADPAMLAAIRGET